MKFGTGKKQVFEEEIPPVSVLGFCTFSTKLADQKAEPYNPRRKRYSYLSIGYVVLDAK